MQMRWWSSKVGPNPPRVTEKSALSGISVTNDPNSTSPLRQTGTWREGSIGAYRIFYEAISAVISRRSVFQYVPKLMSPAKMHAITYRILN